MGEFAAARVAGFEPVGQVFGTTVAFLGSGALPFPGPAGFGRCFVLDGRSAASTRTSADPGNPLVVALAAARELALERAVTECQALGGDGIVGLRVSSADFFTHTAELTVEGTAVRASSALRPPAPFTTHVSGQELARLLRAGWFPFALVFGTAIAACHFDDTMFRQTRLRVGAAGNREVSGYTRIVNDARREARRTLEYAVRARGGDGAVVRETTLHFSERECPRQFEQRADYVAEATIVGSAIVAFDRTARPREKAPLTIMRLDRRTENENGAPVGAAAEAHVVATETKSGAAAEAESLPTPSLGERAFAVWAGRRRRS